MSSAIKIDHRHLATGPPGICVSPLAAGSLVIDKDILSVNLEPVAYKVAVDEGWSLGMIDSTEREYRAFLQLFRNYPDTPFTPSQPIDAFWHHHILDTSKYIEDCQTLFGRYIHHFPYSARPSAGDVHTEFETTMWMIRKLVSDTWENQRSST